MKKPEIFKKLIVERDDAFAVVIDYQEKLMPAMMDGAKLEETVIKLTKGLKALNIPMIVTQQYTKGLGDTVAPIKEAIGEFTPIDKFTFSACQNEEFDEILDKMDKNTAIVFGIESHICVLQTALDLLAQGYDVFVVADCCMSRASENHEFALRRLEAAGVVVTTYESVLYELMGSAKAEGFKEVAKIVK